MHDYYFSRGVSPCEGIQFLLLVISHGLKFLGKHFLIINVVVDPESNKTFRRVLNLTEEMVSTAILFTGVRF